MKTGPRELDMCEMYRGGKTLHQIGDVFGVTRERVRQLIRSLGVMRVDGGAHLTAERAAKKRQERLSISREARTMRTYGCTYQDFVRLNYGMAASDTGSPAYAYSMDRKNHKREGKFFDLTFSQWSELFEQAGGIWNRGRYADGLVLSLRDKTGDFVISNVNVTTLSQNSRETRLQAIARVRA